MEELTKIDTDSQERGSLVLLFKKRCAIESLGVENVETKKWTVEAKPALKREVKKVGVPKSRTARRNAKMRKSHLPQAMTEASSSQKTRLPCQNTARAETSGTGASRSTDERPRNEFWFEEVQKSFNQLDYSKMLQGATFTKKQSEILHDSFVRLSQKMSHIMENRQRFQKMHTCSRCHFSISHQCLHLDYIRGIPFGVELMNQETMAPSQIVVCDCGFFFSHAHLKRTRKMVELSTEVRLTPCLHVYERSIDYSCRKCYSTFVMTNRTENVCYDVTTWDSIKGDKRKKFYNTVESCLHSSPANPLSLHEFYACGKDCCLIFHRCSGRVGDPTIEPTSPGLPGDVH